MPDSDRFQEALKAFDALNSQDTKQHTTPEGDVPYELFFARCMSAWVERLAPDASEAVKLAARCQHLCRWESPRDSYPEGRAGYLRWRQDLKKFHAAKSAEVLAEIGYDAETIERVTAINLKKGLGKDPEVQVIEDALCLVFLEQQYEEFRQKKDRDMMINILRKSWGKMSEQAQGEALKLSYSDAGLALIEAALAED